MTTNDRTPASAGIRVAVASGKGGTGKTLVATNLARVLADQGTPVTYLDCDVEAPNGHLFLSPTIDSSTTVTVPIAQIDAAACTACGACAVACRFSAILALPTTSVVLPDLCQSCGACLLACTHHAITELPLPVGQVQTGSGRGILVRQGRLDVGRAAEHEIVRAVVSGSGSTAPGQDSAAWVVLDAPPGVACTVVETLSAADVVLLVTEPTPAGLHDLKLAHELVRERGLPGAVVLNRSAADDAGVRAYCAAEGLEVLLEIPHDLAIARAYARGDLIVERDQGLRDRFARLIPQLRGLAATGRRSPSPIRQTTPEPPLGPERTLPSIRRDDGKVRELVVLSGKGGTGKTSVAASLAVLAARDRPLQLVDADVDAANLHLLTGSTPRERRPFIGGNTAVVDAEACTGCGLCTRHCRFAAIDLAEADGTPALGDWVSVVDPAACTGCGVCVDVCPDQALALVPTRSGEWFRSETVVGPLTHARLNPGGDNSGKLVSLVRAEGRAGAAAEDRDLVITDGPPGIGCPATAALTGASAVLLVTEPTRSGLHDLRRVLDLAAHLGVPAAVCLNKADLDPELAADLDAEAGRRGLPVLGRLPYDDSVAGAHRAGASVIDHAPASPAAQGLRALWVAVSRWLDAPGNHLSPEGITMTLKIAIPVADDVLSAHFGQCTHFAVFEVDPELKTILAREDLPAPHHEPGVFPVWLGQQGANVVLAGGMGSRAKDLFAENGIEVVTGTAEQDPNAAVLAYLADSLATSDNFCEK